MDRARIELVTEWFEKAGHDLSLARHIQLEAIYRDAVVFHSQQAAEKAVKGFLTYFDITFEKTHDVAQLIKQAAEVEPVLLTWKEQGKFLTKFAVAYRYPGTDVPINVEDIEEAPKSSEGIVRPMLAYMPDEVRPRDGLSTKFGTPTTPGDECSEVEL